MSAPATSTRNGHWDSDSHLLNAAFTAAPSVTVTGYAYLLDFDQSAPNSSATYGISLVGARVFDQSRGSRLTYRLEYAHQQDHANQPLDYATDYQCIEVGYAHGKINGGAAIEILGSDGGTKGFATPLATLHAFNGWADVFLNTPARGLRNVYAWLGGTAPGGVNLRLIYHDFRAESDSAAYGDEWDFQAAKSVGKNWSLQAKLAGFSGAGDIPDVTRYWAQAEYAF